MADIWLVRTKRGKLMGPLPQSSIEDLINKAQLDPMDELSLANHYWFLMRENLELEYFLKLGKEITDKGVDQFKPISGSVDTSPNLGGTGSDEEVTLVTSLEDLKASSSIANSFSGSSSNMSPEEQITQQKYKSHDIKVIVQEEIPEKLPEIIREEIDEGPLPNPHLDALSKPVASEGLIPIVEEEVISTPEEVVVSAPEEELTLKTQDTGEIEKEAQNGIEEFEVFEADTSPVLNVDFDNSSNERENLGLGVRDLAPEEEVISAEVQENEVMLDQEEFLTTQVEITRPITITAAAALSEGNENQASIATTGTQIGLDISAIAGSNTQVNIQSPTYTFKDPFTVYHWLSMSMAIGLVATCFYLVLSYLPEYADQLRDISYQIQKE